MSRAPGPASGRSRWHQDRRLHQCRRPRRGLGLRAFNLFSFIETLIDKANKTLAVNWADELVKATALTKDGAVIHPNFQPK